MLWCSYWGEPEQAQHYQKEWYIRCIHKNPHEITDNAS